MLLMRFCCWCCCCCWCADAADAIVLLLSWCCWCADAAADAADALMLLMRWCCWYADVADALMLLNQDKDLLADLFIAICSSLLLSTEMDKDANVARWGFSTSTFQHMMASWDSDVPMNGGRTASWKDQCWWKSSKRSMAPIVGKHCVPKPTYSQDKMLGWSLVDTLPDVRALHSPSCRSGTSHRKEKTSSCPKNLSTREASRILCLSSPPSSWLRPCLSSCASQPTVAPSGSSPKPPPSKQN